MMTRYASLLLILPLAACGLQMPQFGGNRAPEPALDVAAVDPVAEDTLAAEDGSDDAGAVDTGGALGTTLATLGDASVQGLWLETSLVQERRRGRVTAGNGNSLEVDLIPSGGILGSGSRLSLQAMQALGLPLTAVAELTVEEL